MMYSLMRFVLDNKVTRESRNGIANDFQFYSEQGFDTYSTIYRSYVGPLHIKTSPIR